MFVCSNAGKVIIYSVCQGFGCLANILHQTLVASNQINYIIRFTVKILPNFIYSMAVIGAAKGGAFNNVIAGLAPAVGASFRVIQMIKVIIIIVYEAANQHFT